MDTKQKYLYSIKKAGIAERASYFDLVNEYSIIHKLRLINPKEFEDFLQFFFEIKGFATIEKSLWQHIGKQREALPDGGIDLIVEKDNKKIYIQSKRFLSKIVGVDIIRSFYGSIVDILKDGDKGTIISTSIFSNSAVQYGEEKGIHLIDYKYLLKLIDSLDIKKKAIVLHHLSMIQTCRDDKFIKHAKTCKKCFAPMKKKKGKYGKKDFYGCVNYYSQQCNYVEPF